MCLKKTPKNHPNLLAEASLNWQLVLSFGYWTLDTTKILRQTILDHSCLAAEFLLQNGASFVMMAAYS